MGARSPGRWVVLPAAVGLIALVALTSRSGLAVPAIGGTPGSALVTFVEVVGYVALGVGVVAVPVAFLLYRRRWRAQRGDDREGPLPLLPLWMRLLLVATVLGFIGGQAIIIKTFLDEVGRPRDERPPILPGDPMDPNAIGDGSNPTALIVSAALLIGIAVLAVAVAIRWRALDHPTGVVAVERHQATEEALEVSLEALRNEPDPRRAVIAAYAAMERSLGKAGFGRRRSEAPLEYLRRVLDVSGLADEHLRTITLLFQHARFSDHPVHESMRTQAIDALGGVRSMIVGRP